jgi:hypothetical protein
MLKIAELLLELLYLSRNPSDGIEKGLAVLGDSGEVVGNRLVDSMRSQIYDSGVETDSLE